RVGVDELLAAQVAVERAQACGLALQRRSGDGRPRLRAGRELAEEGGNVGVLGADGVRSAPRKERPVLQQVRAVRLERVARKAALELEVAEEVEHLVLERLLGGRQLRDGHGGCFTGRAPTPRIASALSAGENCATGQRRREELRVLLEAAPHRARR